MIKRKGNAEKKKKGEALRSQSLVRGGCREKYIFVLKVGQGGD